MFLLVLRCDNLKFLGTPGVTNEDISLKKYFFLWLLAVPNSAPILSFGLNWFRVQSLFLVTSLSWVRVQSCEGAKKLDLMFVSSPLIIWSVVDTVSLT